jgi:hypothetical protein
MVAPTDVSMPLNHMFRFAYLLFQVVMVGLHRDDGGLLCKGQVRSSIPLEGLITGRRTIQMRLLRCDVHEINRLVRRRDAFHTLRASMPFRNVTQLVEIARYQPRCNATKRTEFRCYRTLNGPSRSINTTTFFAQMDYFPIVRHPTATATAPGS